MLPAKPIALRPHHLLCTAYYSGHGYSPQFCKTMDELLANLPQNPTIRLTVGPDVLCEACPNKTKNGCVNDCHVLQYDGRTLALCGLQNGDELPIQQARAIARERIIAPGRMQQVCAGCQWSQYCTGEPLR